MNRHSLLFFVGFYIAYLDVALPSSGDIKAKTLRICAGLLQTDLRSPSNETFEDPDLSVYVERFLQTAFAVHATDYFPHNGLLMAGKEEHLQVSKQLTHFALGNLVPGTTTNNWEYKRFAVLTKMDRVLKGSVNFFAQDTAYLGSFMLSTDSIVLVPQDFDVPKNATLSFRVVKYQGGLREAVQQQIVSEGFHIVTMPMDSGYDGDPAYFAGIDINSAEFTQRILRVYSHLRSESATTNLIHRSTVQLNEILDTFSPNVGLSPTEYLLLKLTLERRISLLVDLLESEKWSAEQSEAIANIISSLEEVSANVRPNPEKRDVTSRSFRINIAHMNSDTTLREFQELLNKITDQNTKELVFVEYVLSRLQVNALHNNEIHSLSEELGNLLGRASADIGLKPYITKRLIDYFQFYGFNTSRSDSLNQRFKKLFDLPSVKLFFTNARTSSDFVSPSTVWIEKNVSEIYLSKFVEIFQPGTGSFVNQIGTDLDLENWKIAGYIAPDFSTAFRILFSKLLEKESLGMAISKLTTFVEDQVLLAQLFSVKYYNSGGNKKAFVESVLKKSRMLLRRLKGSMTDNKGNQQITLINDSSSPLLVQMEDTTYQITYMNKKFETEKQHLVAAYVLYFLTDSELSTIENLLKEI